MHWLQQKIRERAFPSQFYAITAPVDYVLLVGNRGGGKTEAMLMTYLDNVGLGYGSDYKGIIFRNEYKYLSEVKERSVKLFNDILPIGYATFHESQSKWTFKDGEKLFLHHAYKESQYPTYHGHQYPFIGFDELTQYPDLKFWEIIKSTNRAALPHIPKKMFATMNPDGPNHNRIKNNFINMADYNHIYTIDRKKYINIFSSFIENKFILNQKDYLETLLAIKDINRRKAWTLGSWDITSGGIIDDIWNRRIHTFNLDGTADDPKKPMFTLDKTLGDKTRYYCVLDWGSARPYAVCFFAVINDTLKFRTKGLIKGDILLLTEIYGTKGEGTNEGLNKHPKDVQEEILKKIENKGYDFYKFKFIADSQIFQQHGIPSIASEMDRINWEPAVKGKDSRKHGLALLRQYLSGAIPDKYGVREKPGLFVNATCRHWISTVVPLPRDKNDREDAATDGEDHLYDCTRYLLQSDFKTASLKMIDF